jgi:DNA-binding HxlR family transcriptional regulator
MARTPKREGSGCRTHSPAAGDAASLSDATRAAEAAGHIRASLVTPVLDLIGDRWTLLLLAALMGGRERFDGLARRIGIARSTLTHRLADLARDGLVERAAYQAKPPRFEYRLTHKGAEMRPILHAIRNWDRAWATAEALEAWPLKSETEQRLVCAACRQPIHARDVSYQATEPRPVGKPRSIRDPRTQRRSRRGRIEAARPQMLTSAADTLGNRSLALVISAAFFGLRRFSDMQRALAMAPNILARCLDELVAAGMFARHVYRERPRRWQYILTEKGLDLYPVIVAQIGWADRWLVGPAGPPLRLTHKSCGRILAPALEPATISRAQPPIRRSLAL